MIVRLARAPAWWPVAVAAAAAAVGMWLAGSRRADMLPAVGAVLVAAVAWLLDDPALPFTGAARWGRRPQLAVRCAVATAVVALGWVTGAWVAGADAWSYDTLALAATLALSLAAATTAGPLAALGVVVTTSALAQALPPRWAPIGARWWWVLAAGVAALLVAIRDPARR